jgi:TRAP-type C4-dicarboxylate transport system substrate-binding protein
MKANVFQKALIILALALLGSSGLRAQTTVLQFNRWIPPTHFVQTEVLARWAADVEKVTEGRVKVQVPSSSLGAPPRQFDLAAQGVADIVWGVQGYTPERFTSSELAELPFLSDSAEALSVAFWRTHQKYFDTAKEYAGVKLLSVHVQPPGELFAKDRPLRNLADIKGLKIRVVNPASGALAEAMGGVAVSAPVTKLYEVLSHGVVDGTFLTTDGVPQFKLNDLIKHRMTVVGGFYNSAFFLAMNPKSWDRLSKRDQQAVESISGEAFAKRIGRAWDEKQVAAEKQLQQQGVQHTRIDGEMLQDLKRRLSGAEQASIKAATAKGIDGEAALKMIRTEVVNYIKN